MKNILSARLSRLHNGEHFGFEEAVLGTLTPSLAGHLNLTAQRGQLRQLHDREAEVYRINQAYRQTKELARLDLFRDKTFNYIKNSVKYYLNTGDNAKKTAAAAVNFVLRPYRLDPVKGYIDNTADMGKFVDDMSVKPYPAHIATLGLTDVLASLKAGNDRFDVLYKARAEEGLNRAGHEKIRTLRHAFDETWRIVATVLPALHFTETNAARKLVVGKAIDEINSRILQMKKTIAAREGRAAASLADVDHNHPDSPTTQPEGPEDEDDDGLPDDPYIDPNA